jgi:hypothetical protein
MSATDGAPEPKPPRTPLFCDECGKRFVPQNGKQRFCTPFHQHNWNNRALKRGYQLYPLIMAWRIDRKSDGLSNLCALADQFAYDEREIKRKRAEKIKSYRTSVIQG